MPGDGAVNYIDDIESTGRYIIEFEQWRKRVDKSMHEAKERFKPNPI